MPLPRVAAATLATALLLGACSEYLPLPEATPPAGVNGCDASAPVGPWRIAGDANADPHVWAEGPGGERREIAWPPGFKSVFWPDLLVLDQDSKKVGHGGDDLVAPPASFAGLVVCFVDGGVAVWRETDLAR